MDNGTSQSQPGGFTLIELLMVVSVVAILLAILMPGMRRAREQARITACAANLREIGIGWAAYLQDYHDEYPEGVNVHRKFREQLDPYLKTVEVFRCPSDRAIWPTFTTPAAQNSYMMSPVLMGRRYHPELPPTHPANARRLNDFPELDWRVRNVTTIQPTVPDASLAAGGDYDWLLVINTDPESRTEKYSFHGKKDTNNLLFFDNHVAFVRQYHGYYITPHYTLNPYLDLVPIARERGLVGP